MNTMTHLLNKMASMVYFKGVVYLLIGKRIYHTSLWYLEMERDKYNCLREDVNHSLVGFNYKIK